MTTEINELGMPAGKLEPLFREAEVMVSALENAKSQRAKSTLIGNFLQRNLNRPTPIEHDGRTGKATLCSCDGRSNQKRYFFEITFDQRECVCAEQTDRTEGLDSGPIQSPQRPLVDNPMNDTSLNSDGGRTETPHPERMNDEAW